MDPNAWRAVDKKWNEEHRDEYNESKLDPEKAVTFWMKKPVSETKKRRLTSFCKANHALLLELARHKINLHHFFTVIVHHVWDTSMRNLNAVTTALNYADWQPMLNRVERALGELNEYVIPIWDEIKFDASANESIELRAKGLPNQIELSNFVDKMGEIIALLRDTGVEGRQMREQYLKSMNLPTRGKIPDFQETWAILHLRTLFEAVTGNSHDPWIIQAIDPMGDRTIDSASISRRLENLHGRFLMRMKSQWETGKKKYSEK